MKLQEPKQYTTKFSLPVSLKYLYHWRPMPCTKAAVRVSQLTQPLQELTALMLS